MEKTEPTARLVEQAKGLAAELGFELKQIKRILGRADFEIVAALHSHRKVLQKNLVRTRQLIELGGLVAKAGLIELPTTIVRYCLVFS